MTIRHKTAKELEAYAVEVPKERREKGAARLRKARDAQMMQDLTGPQVTALERIYQGQVLHLDGFPISRMRMDDMPRGKAADWTLHQVDIVRDFTQWCELTRGMFCRAAVMGYLFEDGVGAAERKLGLRPSTLTLFVREGTDLYARMKGWIGGQERPHEVEVRAIVAHTTKLLPDDPAE